MEMVKIEWNDRQDQSFDRYSVMYPLLVRSSAFAPVLVSVAKKKKTAEMLVFVKTARNRKTNSMRGCKENQKCAFLLSWDGGMEGSYRIAMD